MLVGPVAARCRDVIEGTCAQPGWQVRALAIPPDHNHLFVRVWPSESAAEVVQACKGRTSLPLRTAFAHRLKLPSTWTRRSFASTAGHVSHETIQRSLEAPTRR